MSGGMEEAALFEESIQNNKQKYQIDTITTLVCTDLRKREKVGLSKYGHYVHESKDDMLQHLYEELLDAAVYIRTEIERKRNNGI